MGTLVTTIDPTSDHAQKVWRYMTFARFVWLLQQKKLWLSRADLLGDPWEISLAGDQLEHTISRRPIVPLPLPDVMPDTTMQRSERIIRSWRQRTFVSCWSASAHESHALWHVYCGPTEGVAIQTTFASLQASVGGLPLYRVTYKTPGSSKRTPSLPDLVTKKRPMFAYEQEIRVVLFDEEDTERHPLGHCLGWDPDRYVESIRVHPSADQSFLETVTETTKQYAPSLKDCVSWSAMNAPPPF